MKAPTPIGQLPLYTRVSWTTERRGETIPHTGTIIEHLHEHGLVRIQEDDGPVHCRGVDREFEVVE